MAESKSKFVHWLMRVFSVDEEYIVTHIGYKWKEGNMLRETHVRYYDGTTKIIHTIS